MLLIHACHQACLFLPLVFAVFISYQVLKITDLTAEGSFVFGAALFAICIDAHSSIPFALCASICGGMLAGCLTSILQRMLGFSDLISGILAIFIFNTICLKTMGRPNISLYNSPASLTSFMAFCIVCALFLLLSLILHSRLGLLLKAFGNNRSLLELCGKNEKMYCFMGLCLSNVFAAIGGALSAEHQGFADCSMGTGVVLIALTGVVLGSRIHDMLFHAFQKKYSLQLFSCFLGTFFYFVAVHSLIQFGVDPIHVRLATALIVVCVLALNRKTLARRSA
jgi:putative ABC transport system permease protein